MAGTALDPGSRRIRASVTAAGSELTLAACPSCQPDRHAVGGGNLHFTSGLRRIGDWSKAGQASAGGPAAKCWRPAGRHTPVTGCLPPQTIGWPTAFRMPGGLVPAPVDPEFLCPGKPFSRVLAYW
jgi:hypothetical protein